LSNVVNLLSELIATPSINPRLGLPDDPWSGEARMTERLAQFCRRAGWPWALQAVHPDRNNLIALVEGGRGDVQLWEAHQDTVAVEGPRNAPLLVQIEDGRVYGRGACDVKGGMAAMLMALTRVAATPAAARPTIIVACTVNEECGFTGAKALADIWQVGTDKEGPPRVALAPEGGLTLEQLRALRPQASLVAEPTDLNVVVAHRGVVRWQCRTHGRAAHSSRPEQGANAIYAMMSVVRLVDMFHRHELARRPPDPLCGPSTVCVTTIRGGTGANTVPDRAVIDVDRRLTPAESPQEAIEELVHYLAGNAELGGCRLEHDPPWMQSGALSSGANRQWAEQVVGAVRSTGARCEAIGVPYGTNAATIAAAGIPTVVFGPGSIDQAHTVDEWIAIDQLEVAVEAYCAIAQKLAPGQ
jgi:acetylornithine deacetylase/succinyl-diaminopimelate desuccinylase-like protein